MVIVVLDYCALLLVRTVVVHAFSSSFFIWAYVLFGRCYSASLSPGKQFVAE